MPQRYHELMSGKWDRMIETDVPIHIRPAGWDLTRLVLPLYTNVFGQEAAEAFKAWQSVSWPLIESGPDNVVFGAYAQRDGVDDLLIGMGAAYESPACEHVVALGHLAVHPDWRGRGIARALVATRAEWAQAWRPEVTCDRVLEFSCYDALVPYHRRHGFVVVRRHRPGTSCIMQATAPEVIAACAGQKTNV